MTDHQPTPETARANRTLAARAAADLAGDTLTAIYDALRAADGMPRMQQAEAFESAARALVATLRDSIAADILETEHVSDTAAELRAAIGEGEK